MKIFLMLLILVLLFTQVAAQDFTLISTGDIVNDGGWNYGCAWGDYDNDNYYDLFVVNNENGSKNNFLYHNNGDGSFTRILTGDIVNDGGSSYGCAWADYNNDGKLDLFVSNYNENNFLYKGNGDGTFEKISSGAIVTNGGSSSCPAWCDFDNDGYIDLYVSNRTSSNFLYHNNGDGTFDRITNSGLTSENKNSAGCSWADCNGDGYSDLLVTNSGPDFNSLFINNGDGSFSKQNVSPFSTDEQSFGSVSWGDYDNDGDFDIFTSPGLLPYCYQLYLYENDGAGNFERVPDIPFEGVNSNGATSFVDYDNDGDLDIFVGTYDGTNNILLQNDGSGNFSQITSGALLAATNYNRGTVWADYDNDGQIDLFLAVNNYYSGNNRLLHNDGNSNNWLHVKCVGTVSNKCGIGAIVRLNTPTATMTRQISSQTGADGSSQDAMLAFFGLGSSSIVSSLIVEWPSGIIDTTIVSSVNQLLTIVEGTGTGISSDETEPAFIQDFICSPNPCSGQSNIMFSLLFAAYVDIHIYDMNGRLVQQVLSAEMPTGLSSVAWNASALSPGIYACRIVSNSDKITTRIIRI